MSSPQQAATHAPEASALNAEAASFIPDDSPCQLENFDFSCHNGDFLKELLEDDLTKMERLERQLQEVRDELQIAQQENSILRQDVLGLRQDVDAMDSWLRESLAYTANSFWMGNNWNGDFMDPSSDMAITLPEIGGQDDGTQNP